MEKVKRIQELRRSNAATAVPSKKKYSRKNKYKDQFEKQLIFGAGSYPQGLSTAVHNLFI